jgi:hypothetical protein
VLKGAGVISDAFQKMRSNRIQAVMFCESGVGFEGVQ